MKPFEAASAVYLPIFVVWAIFELIGLFFGPTGMLHPGLVPWYTFSEMIWSAEAAWHPFKVIALFLLSLLLTHLVTGWPN